MLNIKLKTMTLVTTVMAFVYPNVSKLYENYKLQVKYYDQPEDIYALKLIYDSNPDTIDGKTKGTCETDSNVVGVKDLNASNISDVETDYYIYTESDFDKIADMELSELYIVNYMSSPTSTNYNFNRYLKRMKKTTNDRPAYRLIGIFGSGDNKRYASIKIENPNPNRNCNL